MLECVFLQTLPLLVYFMIYVPCHRFRKKGEKILHSKYIVICVIILTITDCALVIAELILDLYSVKSKYSSLSPFYSLFFLPSISFPVQPSVLITLTLPKYCLVIKLSICVG